MKRIVGTSYVTFGIGLGLLGLIFFNPVAAKAQTPIKVGIIDSYTGPPTTFTYDVRDAFKLAVDEMNAKGGVSEEGSNLQREMISSRWTSVSAWPRN